MPKRTREHTLEEESRKFFEGLVPNNWVVRKPDPDYGIDTEIEIFLENGSSTGLMFFAQLKATDTKELSGALKLSFEKDTLRYYYQLELPVLIVRYHSPTKSLYHRWAHSVDLYYSAPDTETYTISFSPDSIWEEDTPASIQTYLEQLRTLKSGVPLPIELSIDYDVLFSSNTYPLKLETELVKLIDAQSLPIEFATKKRSVFRARLTIAQKEVKISILEAPTLTLHNLQDKDGKYSEPCLPHDLLCLVGWLCYQIGRKNVASQILTNNLQDSSLLNSFGFMDLLRSLIASERDFEAGVKIMENILATDREDKIRLAENYYTWVLGPVYAKFGYPQNLEKKFADVKLRFCEVCEKGGDNELAGMNYYNLANAMKGSKLFAPWQVISWYKRAARLWEEYLTREYFWAELGAVLFNHRKPLCSSRFYKKALTIKEKPWVIAQCADALLFAGRYKESLNYFRRYLREEKNPDVEWVLKEGLLNGLIESSGIEVQKRLKKEAHSLATVNLQEAQSSREAALASISKLGAIREKDLLCPMMWTNLANLYNYVGEKEKAFTSALAVCLIQPSNLEAWFACIGWGSAIDSPLFGALVFLAYEKNGEEIINFLLQKIEAYPDKVDSGLATKLKLLFDGIREHHATHTKEKYSVLRIPNGKKDYKEIKVKADHRS